MTNDKKKLHVKLSDFVGTLIYFPSMLLSSIYKEI